MTTVGIAADPGARAARTGRGGVELAGVVGTALTASASLRVGGVGFAVGCRRAIGSAGGGVGLGAGVARVSSAGPPQGRAIMRITISRPTPPNAPSASGRRDLLRAFGVTSCFFAAGDDWRDGAARGAGASSQAATSGGDGGNSDGRPRAAQKS